MSEWNPQQYLKFGDERTQPSIDLARRIRVDHPLSIMDLGCGPGNSTAVLRERWPDAEIIGLDSSKEMIEQAARDYPRGKWVVGDAAALAPERGYDILFSNAVLQWIPDHGRLIPRLFRLVKRGGALAVQVPADNGSPLHRALMTVSGSAKWRAFTAGCENLLLYHDAEYYYSILSPLAAVVDLWETSYYHVLSSHQDLVEWYKGTGMRPFLAALPDEEGRRQFQEEVLTAAQTSYPVQRNNKILYPFKRTFFIAYAAGG
ncbi:MAG TPA: methyltransferase domain-containing protein [Syntrophorhabdales bacterium]|nr:methyltransferase domain-containing protein [Syntrophorhabdales bacterium]